MDNAKPIEQAAGTVGAVVKKAAASTAAAVAQAAGKALSDLDFVTRFAPLDVAKSQALGIPIPGIFTAWAAMESNFAMSGLTGDANNLFGIKAGPKWIAEGKPYVTEWTKEYEGTPQEVTIRSNFRKYASWQESLDNLIVEMQTDFKQGGALQALQRGDIAGFLQGIEASGYSTAANYGQRIENFMRQIARLG